MGVARIAVVRDDGSHQLQHLPRDGRLRAPGARLRRADDGGRRGAGRPRAPAAVLGGHHERLLQPGTAVRERLLEQGFIQTTLTNFERAKLQGTPRSFRYEPYGFSPETYDVFGFGPAALNIFDAQFGWLKTANPEVAGDYLAARARGRTAELVASRVP